MSVKLLKMPLTFVTGKDNVFQIMVPQTLYRGSTPGPRWGTSVPQTPSLVQFFVCITLTYPTGDSGLTHTIAPLHHMHKLFSHLACNVIPY